MKEKVLPMIRLRDEQFGTRVYKELPELPVAAKLKMAGLPWITLGNKRYTYGSLHRGTGITRSHLSRIFNGQRNPSLDMQRRICQFCHCSLDQLDAAIRTRGGQTSGKGVGRTTLSDGGRWSLIRRDKLAS